MKINAKDELLTLLDGRTITDANLTVFNNVLKRDYIISLYALETSEEFYRVIKEDLDFLYDPGSSDIVIAGWVEVEHTAAYRYTNEGILYDG